MLTFIDSNGGPLIMLQRDLLPNWGGIDNIGGVTNPHRNRVPFERPSDYDRACEIRSWIAPLQVSDRAGVVFSGDRLGLALVRQGDAMFFAVRPYYEIEDLQDHIKFVKENPNCFTKDFETLISCSPAIVFDSASPGWDIIGGRLEIDALPGIYEVSTYWQKIPNAEVVFHKFNLCQGR
jgi:Immunity protein 21